jgi:hypothetical protein
VTEEAEAEEEEEEEAEAGNWCQTTWRNVPLMNVENGK